MEANLKKKRDQRKGNKMEEWKVEINWLRWNMDNGRRLAIYRPEVGKHPDLMVGPPTSTVFPTNDRKFEISQFFRKKFEKI
jgi:hypothetical protein